MANQTTPTKPATIKDVIVPGNNESGCTRACNGNSTCGGVCGGQCYKQVHTNSQGVDTVMGYSCRGTGEIVDPLPRPLPKTIAALLSTIGSPQFDPFEGGKFDPYAYAGPFTDTYITTVNDSLCRCGTNIGCGGNCDCNRGGACYCWVVQIYKRSNNGKPGVWSAPTYLCAQTAAIAFSTFNASQGRTRGNPNLFDNFPISHPLNNNPIK